ncbi:hypothetical protein N1851_000028 [Merluccius polli]|uniref:Uncharacterized protein n=1 Tax=Merluccius polli TaxID=89951 RepID=A0AA47NE33_MERPO|nr:hypothetical protein N1851_000028 [Merluccius polli]
MTASDIWMAKFKALNVQLEGIARQRAKLASEHQWTEMKEIQAEDELILKSYFACGPIAGGAGPI